MEKIPLKRGDTFKYNASVTVSNGLSPPSQVPLDITGVAIRAQVRNKDELVDDLVVSNRNDALGTYVLTSSGSTQAWPAPKELVCDIEYTLQDGQVVSTETFIVATEKDVTRT